MQPTFQLCQGCRKMVLGTHLPTEKEKYISLALYSKSRFSDEEAEGWGTGTLPGSHSHYVTE